MSADLENCYAADAEGVGQTVFALRAGLAGGSIEDRRGDRLLTSSATSLPLPRTYRTRHQQVIAWILVGVLLVSAVAFVAVPHQSDSVYVTGVMSIFAAIGLGRFALCRVIASDDGVRVVNLLHTVQLRWDEIDGFEVTPYGPCQIGLKDGKRLSMTGIQQKNISGMLGTQNTPERRMIDELNALLQARSRSTGAGSGAAA